MCAVSFVGDYFRDTIPQRPWYNPVRPYIDPVTPAIPMPTGPLVIGPNITREEFDALKRDVEELKLLLKAAKRFDEKTGQPDCETESKVALIKRLADLVGVDMKEVFPSGT